MRCDHCGFDNPPAQTTCANCAAELGAERRCPNCDALNPAKYRFCGYCGAGLGEPITTDSERRHITVMFCDLHRSTVLAETMDIEDYRDLINTYLSAVHDVVAEHHGFIAQDFGDGVLAYFGFPVAREDDALRAVRCAMTVMEVITELNGSAGLRYGISMKVRVGMHTGNVITGNIGSARKRDQLAVGSVPNIAARIESEAKPGEVLISASTFELVRRDVTVEFFGSRQLKNVSDLIGIYRVSGIRQLRADEESGSAPPFVGRDSELNLLMRLHGEAVRGTGKLVFVRGEPGIGKSRLLDELRRATDGSRWVICRCSTIHSVTPLFPVLGALNRMIDPTRAGSTDDRQGGLARWLSRGGIESPEARAAIASTLGIVGYDEGAPVAAQSLKERLELLKDWLYGLGEREPLAFVIEDMHWADPSTQEFAGLLARTIQDSRLFVLVTSRPEFVPEWEPHANGHALVELGRLDESDCERLLREWTLNNLTEEINRELIRRADGVPLYLEELTRALVVAQSVLKDQANLEQIIPDSLRDLLMARIDSLGDAKEILQIGAVLGRSFNRQILTAVTNILPARLDVLLHRIVDAGLIVELASDFFRFKHSLIQETAYETLLRSRRTELHGRVLDAILENFPQVAESDPVTLARHQEGAGDYLEAAKSYLRAGNLAWDERNAYEEAITNFDRGLNLVKLLPVDDATRELRAELLHDKSRPMQAQQGYANEELQPILSELRELTRNRFNTLLSTWGYHCMNGDRDETIAVAQKLYGLVDETQQTRQTACAKFVVGSTEFYQGHFHPARVDLEAALAIGEARGILTSGDGVQGDDPVFLSHLVIAWCASLLGYPEQADAYLARVRRLTLTEFAKVQLNTWQMFCNDDFRRDPNLTLRLASEIESTARAHQFDRWSSLGRIFRLRSRLLLGGYSNQLIAELNEALDATLQRQEVTEGYDLTRTADVLVRLRQHAAARRALDRASELGRHNLGSLHLPEADRVEGVLAVREGREAAAADRFHRAIARASECGSRTQQLRAHLSFAFEMPAAARELAGSLRELVSTFDEGLDTPLLRQARELVG